jgi:integrase
VRRLAPALRRPAAVLRDGHHRRAGERRARRTAGRPDLRFHDLRHTGAVLAAQTGATLAELMARLGHSTLGAALRYQHAAAGRDAQIAVALSRITNGAAPS